VKSSISHATVNPWDKEPSVSLDSLGQKWKKQLMFQDPFIRGFLNTRGSPRATTARSSDGQSVAMAYDLALAGDTPKAPLGSARGSQTERQKTWRRRLSSREYTEQQEKNFTLRQHVLDQAIPEYDAILDQHAKGYVETSGFVKHLAITRPLTPEHQHILDNRVKMKENADLAVMALTGILPAAPNTARGRRRSGSAKKESALRVQSAPSSFPGAGRPNLESGTVDPKERSIMEMQVPSVDWADSPLMQHILEDGGSEASTAREFTEEELTDEGAIGLLFEAAIARIEQLWEEVCFPDAMRETLYRRNILQVLRAIWEREGELQRVLKTTEVEAADMWKLRNLTVGCLEAIQKWQKIFPWNKMFVFQGRDYIEKTNTDLTLLQGKLSVGTTGN